MQTETGAVVDWLRTGGIGLIAIALPLMWQGLTARMKSIDVKLERQSLHTIRLMQGVFLNCSRLHPGESDKILQAMDVALRDITNGKKE